MKMIAIDDEKLVVEYMLGLLRQVEPEAEIYGFTEAEEAFDYLAKNQVDVAFVDIDLGKYNGIDLAKRCKELCPQVNIIFVTGYSSYTMDAFKMHASGYLVKPVRKKDLSVELRNLRYPISDSTLKRVKIQTFGNFEIFVDGKPLKFPRKKCRECLAYLVDRKGARVAYAEISSVLWEDKLLERTVKNGTQKVISDMMKSLREVNAQDIIIKTGIDIALNTDMVECDYLQALSGDVMWFLAFNGEYMSNYSWAENTLGELMSWKKIKEREQ